MQPLGSIRSRTLLDVLGLLAAFALAAVVSGCRPGPPPNGPPNELASGSPSGDSQPGPSLVPEAFSPDDMAALYEEIRNEVENPDPDRVAQLGLDPYDIEENTRQFEEGAPHKDVPGFEDSFRSFEQGDYLSAYNKLETAFKTFIAGKCFSPLISDSIDLFTLECIALPAEEVVAVDPLFEYLPEPGKGGPRFSVLRQKAIFKIATLLRVLAAQAKGLESQPSPVSTPSPATEVEATPAATLVPAPIPEEPQAIQPQTHTVGPGETLFGIAMLYGTSVDELLQLNNVPNRDLIYPGETLVLPGRVEATPAATPVLTPTLVPTPTPTPAS